MSILSYQKAVDTILEYRRNEEYLRDNVEAIRREYAGKYVVIYDCAVQYAFEDAGKISDLAKTLTEDQLASALIEYISKEGEVYIL